MSSEHPQSSPIRILALMEAASVTGPAKNLIAFARGLPAVELSVVTFQRGEAASRTAFMDAVSEAGLQLHVIHERRRFDRGVFRQLRDAADACRPDIIQSHSVKSHFLVRSSGLSRQYPWLAFHHGYTAPDLRMRLYNQLDRWSLPAATRVVTVCSAFALELQRRGVSSGRIHIQHNMVQPFDPADPAAVAQLRAGLGVPQGSQVVLAIGRLSREKGHLDLIEAIRALYRPDRPDRFRLVLVGEGPERRAIEERCARYGLAGCVILAGHQADVRPYYSMASVAAIPSHSEGSPNVLLEAMAAGVPAIAASVGGIPEIAADGKNALLVPRRDPAALARGLERLLSNQTLAGALAAAARETVLRRHTPAAYRESMLGLYREILTYNISA